MKMEELLKILACPACHGDLELLHKDERQAFFCKTCDLVYRIEDDIPVMLISEAIPREEWKKD